MEMRLMPSSNSHRLQPWAAGDSRQLRSSKKISSSSRDMQRWRRWVRGWKKMGREWIPGKGSTSSVKSSLWNHTPFGITNPLETWKIVPSFQRWRDHSRRSRSKMCQRKRKLCPRATSGVLSTWTMKKMQTSCTLCYKSTMLRTRRVFSDLITRLDLYVGSSSPLTTSKNGTSV